MTNDEQITVFAKTNFRNQEVPFGIKTDDRRRHMYVLGKTGMGKTTLMENMVIQDIRNGHGVAFLDPHGDSVQRILDSIPSSRVNDVVYFNPADMEFPIAFNILEAVDAKYKHLVASGLMGVFTKIWANLWSARMEYILNNTILALLDSPGNTLLGITRMYVDKKYRKKIVDNIKDPMVRAFWVDEFANYNEKYRTEAIAPIQNKVGQFLSSGIVRNIVGQPKSTIDLRDIMDNQKILIMDLSKGRVGEDNSALLGAMIVTKLQLAAMSRTDIPEHERKDFYLYVDEFQNFATESFATILSEARKYRLCLIVGHQYIAQLEQDKNTKVRDAIFGNVGTMVVFRVGAADAEFLETEFDPIFLPNDLVNLPKYQIILKLMINGVASEPFSATTLPPKPEFFSGNGEKVIKVSRERYANPVAEVEDRITRWMGAEFHQGTAELAGHSADGDTVVKTRDTHENREIRPRTEEPKIMETPRPQPMPIAVEEKPAQVQVVNIQIPSPEVSLQIPEAMHSEPLQPKQIVPAQISRVEEFKPVMRVEMPQQASRREQRPHDRQPLRQRNGQPNSHYSDRQSNRPSGGRHSQDNNHRERLGGPNKHKQDPRKANPIWDTVATINTQKVKEEKEKINAVLQVLEPDLKNRGQNIREENHPVRQEETGNGQQGLDNREPFSANKNNSPEYANYNPGTMNHPVEQPIRAQVTTISAPKPPQARTVLKPNEQHKVSE